MTMSVSSVSTSSPTASSQSSATKPLTSTDFLKMIVANLENQNPYDAASTTDMMSQYESLANFQATQELNSTMQQSTPASLVGKTVSVSSTSSDGTTVSDSGVVTSSRLDSSSNDVMVTVNGNEYTLSDITSYNQASTSSTSSQ